MGHISVEKHQILLKRLLNLRPANKRIDKDTLICIKAIMVKSAISCCILVLLADWIFQAVNFNFTRLLRQKLC